MKKITLINVSNDVEFYPSNRQLVADSDAEYDTMRTLFAEVLKQYNKELKRLPLGWIKTLMINGNFPAVPSGYCDGLACIANSGDHSKGKTNFCPFDAEIEDADAYFYKTANAYCIAIIPDNGKRTKYYRVIY